MTNLDSILKSRDITLLTNVCIVKAMVFPVVRYGMWELGTIKKVEHWRIAAFKLWCWRRLLRVPWTARRSNQSIRKDWLVLNIHWKDWCWSWSFNTSATWCEEPTDWKRSGCWERLRAKGEEGSRGWDGLDGITNSMDMNVRKPQEIAEDREGWHAEAKKSQTRLSDWTELNCSLT